MTPTEEQASARASVDAHQLERRLAELEALTGDLRRQLAEAAAREAGYRADAAKWQALIDSMPQIVWVTRPDGWHVHFNRNWLEYTGLTLEQSLGFGWNPPFHPEDRDRAAARWEEAVRTGEPYEIEYRLRRHDGVYHWMLGRAVPLRDASGRIETWFGTCTDIEELKEAQGRIDEQARLLDRIHDAIVVHDLDHRVRYWNRAAERIHGWSSTEAIGRSLGELCAPELAQVDRARDAVLRDGEWTGELRYVSRSGSEVLMEGRWSLLRASDGRTPRAILAVNTDVTERRRIETQYLRALEERATLDPLTGLGNRHLLFDRLELLLGQRQRAGIAIAFVDLDGFKSVNDRFGHLAGDQLLVHVAERLRATVRQGDVVARIGGDEFVIVGEADDDATALQLGQRIARALSGNLQLAVGEVEIAGSVGVAYVDRDEDVDVDVALSRADAVMYQVKRSTGGAAAIEARDGAER
jgi:diguanylate cyclase (GGDEF)-like protein/PAS domain S-box-containing protein